MAKRLFRKLDYDSFDERLNLYETALRHAKERYISIQHLGMREKYDYCIPFSMAMAAICILYRESISFDQAEKIYYSKTTGHRARSNFPDTYFQDWNSSKAYPELYARRSEHTIPSTLDIVDLEEIIKEMKLVVYNEFCFNI